MKKLIRVFDDALNYINTIVPLSLKVDEVVYVYHRDIKKSSLQSVSQVLKKYNSNIKVTYKYVNNIEDELDKLLCKECYVDISTTRYLSFSLFEKSIINNYQIIYYNKEEGSIKDYRTHTNIVDKVFNLDIEDMVLLGGGKIDSRTMHKPIDLNNSLTVNAIVDVVENNINNYSMFVNYIQRINTFITHRNIGGNKYKLSLETKNKIIYDEMYQKNAKYNLFKIEGDILTFLNTDIRNMFSIAGSFLENYLYIKLSNSKLFEQVLMSSIVKYTTNNSNLDITCEIDCLAIRNNRLLFISCKSNKVDTDALNEIKIHNTVFGNALSMPVICTIEDLSKTSPSEYLKAKELSIAVIDKTSFENKKVETDIASIIDNTYKYERI